MKALLFLFLLTFTINLYAAKDLNILRQAFFLEQEVNAGTIFFVRDWNFLKKIDIYDDKNDEIIDFKILRIDYKNKILYYSITYSIEEQTQISSIELI